MQEPDSNKGFTPGQYVRVRSDEDEPWEDVRIYVEKQGSLHYVTKAGEVRYADGDATEGFLFCKTWVPEKDELVLWAARPGYIPAIMKGKDGSWNIIQLVSYEDQETANFYLRDVKLDRLIPYYLPPFKPAPHE